MRTIGAYEAKTHLPRLLDEVEKGERITITKHGRPVAVLIPPGIGPVPDPDSLLRQMRALRKLNRLGGVTIRELIEEGRRW